MNGDLFPTSNPGKIDPVEFQTARELPGSSLYLGHYMPHFGHFLAEMLPSMWMYPDFARYDRFVFHPFCFGTGRPRYMSDAFKALGLPADRVHLIDTPVRFHELTVAERLMRHGESGNVHMMGVYRHLSRMFAGEPGQFPPLPDRVYLSRLRNNLRKGSRSVANEGWLEREFARRGFAVVHPELLAFSEQVRIVSGASVLCGLGGSAMHNAIFARPDSLLLMIGDARRADTVHPTQAVMNELADLDAHLVPFRGSVLDRRSRAAWIDVAATMRTVDAILPANPSIRNGGCPSGRFRPSRSLGTWLAAKTGLRLLAARFRLQPPD